MRTGFVALVGLTTTSLIIAWSTGQWWLITLGLLAGAIIGWRSRAADESPLAGLDARHHARALALMKSHASVLERLESTPSTVSLASVERLIDQALALLARHQSLEGSLAITDETATRFERDRLARLARDSNDAAVSAQYAEARAAREAQLHDRSVLRDQVARLDAEISSVHAKLDAIDAQLLRLGSASSAAGLTTRVNDELSALSNELGALAQAYESLTPTKERM